MSPTITNATDQREQQREEKRRSPFLKQSVDDIDSLCESLGKFNRIIRIRPESEYWTLGQTVIIVKVLIANDQDRI
jgi:hypothetical protein